jgi:hypothetical protein
MAITITDQPTANTFWSSEYPCVVKATSNNASIKYLKFQLKDGNSGTALTDVPAYYAPQIDSEFTFNVSDYMNNFLYIIRDDLVSFDVTPAIHYYDNVCRFIALDITEIETDGTTDDEVASNGFYMAKAKHQVYNANGTAHEYFDNRYYLTSLPYSRQEITPSLDAAFFFLQDGRNTPNYVTDYSRITFFNFALGVTGGISVTAYEGIGAEYATCAIDPTLAGGLFDQGKVCSMPVSISDIHDLSIASGESGWVLFGTTTPVSVATVKSTYLYIGVTISNTTDSSFATTVFGNPAKYNIRCPKTFIYMNRFGVHEVLTLNTKTNESVVSSRDNATLVNTEWDGAYTNDLGAYLLTGARQRAINPKSEFEFQVNNTLPFPPEQAREIALDFFASPVHYVVDTSTEFGTDFDVTHPDTGYEKVRRISINDGKVDVIKNNRPQRLSFSYRYADV